MWQRAARRRRTSHPEAGTPLGAPHIGNDDHGDRHGNDHEMTATTGGMMADGPLSPAGLRAIDPCWHAANKEAR